MKLHVSSLKLQELNQLFEASHIFSWYVKVLLLFRKTCWRELSVDVLTHFAFLANHGHKLSRWLETANQKQAAFPSGGPPLEKGTMPFWVWREHEFHTCPPLPPFHYFCFTSVPKTSTIVVQMLNCFWKTNHLCCWSTFQCLFD